MTGLLKDNINISFKLVKKGSIYTAYYSEDGKGYKLLGSTEAILSDVKAGLLVCNGSDINTGSDLLAMMLGQTGGGEEQKFEVRCDYFRILNTGIRY